MTYYHINPATLTILSGPHVPQSDYLKRLTACGNPECLDLSQYDCWPEVREPLGEHQKPGAPIVANDSVTIPAVDKTADDLAAELAQRRAAMACTPRQARLALAQQGLLTAVEAFVAAGSDALRIEWQYATEIKRIWPPVAEFAAANDLSDETLDGLFELAATL